LFLYSANKLDVRRFRLISPARNGEQLLRQAETKARQRVCQWDCCGAAGRTSCRVHGREVCWSSI